MLLVAHFLQKFGKELGKEVRGALALFEQYHWPGNIRELKNVIERALVLGTGEMLGVEALPESGRRQRQPRGTELELPETGLHLEATLDQLERRLLERAHS